MEVLVDRSRVLMGNRARVTPRVVRGDFGDVLEIDGRRLAIRHLDRVVFPATGTTKAAVLAYYVRIADVMLPHLRDRLLHMHRYPEGVQGPRFWQKDCP